MDCDMTTLIFPRIRLRDRVTIKTGPRHIVHETEEGNFEMVIKSAQKSDTGVYTCKIINEYGTKQCEGKLEVKGKGFSYNNHAWFVHLAIISMINQDQVLITWLEFFCYDFFFPRLICIDNYK